MKKRLNLQLDESDIIMIKTVAAQEGLLPGKLIVKAVEEYQTFLKIMKLEDIKRRIK